MKERIKPVLKYTAGILGSFLLFLIETSIPPAIRPFGAVADLSVVLTLIWAWLFGKREGCVLGIIFGVMHDALSGELFFAGPLLCMLTGYFVGAVSEMHRKNRFDFLIADSSACAGFMMIRTAGGAIFGSNMSFFPYLWYVQVPRYVLTFILTLLFLTGVLFLRKQISKITIRRQLHASVERQERG